VRATLWTRRHEADVATRRVAHEVAGLERERAALADANARLRALHEDKEAFLAIASHDLRSPLTTVRILAEQLQAGDAGDPQRTGLLLEASVGRMLGIIDRLLTTESIERGGGARPAGRVELGRVVEAAIAGLRPAAAVKGTPLRLSVLARPRISGEAGAVDQVVTNLVDNALKFSPPGSPVEVTLGVVADRAVLAVRDRGPGLSEDDRSRLFQKGARLSARPTGGEASHGLGLFVVQRLVQEMGGAVEAQPRAGGGAVFTVRWPVA